MVSETHAENFNFWLEVGLKQESSRLKSYCPTNKAVLIGRTAETAAGTSSLLQAGVRKTKTSTCAKALFGF